MAKLKITQKQYQTILMREQEARLIASGDIITENLDETTVLLEEGWKEVILGVAMMLGVGLTGQNKAIAQTAVKNQETMAQIKSTLEDEEKVKELADMLKQKGMKDPEGKLAQNAEKVMDAYNRIAKDDDIKYRVDVKVVSNLQGLKGKLGQGYALKNIDTKTDTINGKEHPTITVTDTLEINLGTDNLFVTGGFTLSKAGIDTITTAIEEIKKQGGKVLNVEIESSTDAELIPKFKTSEDPTGNIQLAHLRTQSVTNLLGNLDAGTKITHREIPNNGSAEVSTQDFINARHDKVATSELRAKTSEYRYVRIKLVVLFENKTPVAEVPKVISRYRFELVKVIESTGKTHSIKTNTTFRHKKFSCKKSRKGKSIVDKCTTF